MRTRHVVVLTLVVACHAAPPSQVTVPVVSATSSVSAPPSEPLVIAATFGAFGCRGWSPSRRLALCFVGSTAAGTAPELTAKFIALDDDARAPEDVSITLTDAFSITTAKIPADVLAKLREETRDFVASWSDVATFTGMDGGARVGTAELSARSSQTDPGGENSAPRHHVELVVRLDKDDTVDEVDGAISAYGVAAYLAGRTILIERTYSIADEGQYEQHVDVLVTKMNEAAGGRALRKSPR